MRKITFPFGLRKIGSEAFSYCTSLKEVQLSEKVESIGKLAFQCCTFTKFRCPPLVVMITEGMLGDFQSLFSLEMPDNIRQVDCHAFRRCRSLRNVALASNTVVQEWTAFSECLDLLQLFYSEEAIVNALKNRFDGLQIHCCIYYLSYHHTITTDEFLNSIVTGENGELDPTGLQQDCLGMTPLHILACSTIH